ncbi:MAG: GldG family protein [Mangrovibacterium sp.]
MNKRKSILLYLSLIAGILILVNILAGHFYFRLDLTEDKQYTLSDASRNILKELKDPVTVTAYFSGGLPPRIAQAQTAFRNLLAEYRRASGGNIHYEFIDPGKDELTEQQAIQAGISPVLISVREKNEAVQKKAYLGAVLSYQDQTETIPFVQQGSAMEYALSKAVKKLTVEEKPLIGIIQGHGEPAPGEFKQAMEELKILYQTQPVNLTDSTNLGVYKTLCLIAPTDTVPEAHLYLLDQYLKGGGNLYLALNRVEGELNRGMGYAVHTGLESWLQEKGLELEDCFVTDVNCGEITIQQQQGLFTFSTPVSFPYLPIASSFADHPVTGGLESVIFPFVSPIRFNGDSTLQFTPLVMSSGQSGTQTAPVWFDVQRQWGKSDFPEANLTLAALLEGGIAGKTCSRIMLTGDGDFAVNRYGDNTRTLNPDNVSLMVNAIDYLSDETGLISLRTKGITFRPLKQLEDGTKTALKYLNFLLPVLLIVLYGIYRSQRNRVIRLKRMQEDLF